MESSFRIARVGGIEIGANWSWLIVFAIVVWSLATALFPTTYPDLGGGTHLVMAVVTAVLFFGSILLHELGHAFRALREGVPIEGITLWLFGGVARMRGHPPTAGAAFRVSAAGPVVSLGLALAFGALAYGGAQLDVYGGVQGVTDYLARINALVLVFNLVPALPLDGGRILQSWIWHRTGRFTEATLQAARAGRMFGWLLVAVGLLGLFSGTGIGAIWIAFIGWFLIQAAGSEATHAMLRRALGSTRVSDAMSPEPATVPVDRPVGELVEQAWQRRHSSYPVVDGGELVGLVSVRDAARVPADERPFRSIGDVMTTRADLATIDADAELAEVLETGGLRGDQGRLPVLRDGRLVGILAASDVTRAIDLGEMRTADREETASSGTRRRSPGPAVWLVVGLLFALVAAFLYSPPVVVLSPGETLAVEDDITIDGVATTAVDGDYRLTSVGIGRTNALGALVAWVRPDRDVLPIGEIVPSGVNLDEYVEDQQDVFAESRMLAAVAGARAAGYDVPVTGDGAEVLGVLPDSPAAEALDDGDTIVAVDGTAISTAADLRRTVQGREPGAQLTLTVDRAGDGGREQATVETASLPDLAGEAGLGAQVTTRDLSVDLPFEVSFLERDIGGPSAGLAYALAVADLLDDDDLADGRTIAATGTIAVDGDVGPVGAVGLKAVGADDAGADLFIVPDADAARAGDADVEIRAAGSLEEALELLRTTA